MTHSYKLMDNYVISHWRIPWLLGDRTEVQVKSTVCVDAEVSSGDYFTMIASRLDEISRATDDYSARICLEDIVSDLIYLQDNYTIVKNKQTE